jgi:hypothetical protein
MATVAYLDIDQGSDFTSILELENDDGTPMDLTGFQVYSQFRKSYNSAIGYSFEATVVSPTNLGKVQLKLSGLNSSAIRPGRYLYDVEIISISNVKTRVVEGILTINAEITKIPVP